MSTISPVEPPWVVFPNHPPDLPFWRQTGDAYLTGFLQWWRAQPEPVKLAYLDQRQAPGEWRDHLKPGGFLDWLATVDDEARG